MIEHSSPLGSNISEEGGRGKQEKYPLDHSAKNIWVLKSRKTFGRSENKNIWKLKARKTFGRSRKKIFERSNHEEYLVDQRTENIWVNQAPV
jgi:hypothetical protein